MPGTYTFRPIQANLTHDTDWLGKMDPYCSYRVGATRVKGPVCRNGGKFPKWEDATVNVPAPNDVSMVVDLMDKDKILHDDNIGTFVIDLVEIQNIGRISKWYPVYYHKKPAGEILMEAAFTPELVQREVHVVQPVLVEKTIVEPVLVDKVVHQEVYAAPVHQQEFHSGPVISGISQIHHGGVGHGLVPQHAGIATHGTTYTQGSTLGHNTTPYTTESHLHHGTHHGTHLNQGFTNTTLNQGTLNQGFPSTTLNQGTLNQGFPNTTLNQGTLNQGTLNNNLNPGLNQGFNQQQRF